MNKAYLILGGNMGNRTALLNSAMFEISTHIGTIIKTSTSYETEAWGMLNATSFYNKVILVETRLTANDLMNACMAIEEKFGRKRSLKKYESRQMDIDILFFNAENIESASLTIPHPRLHIRRFVLEPLNEIAADFVHPIFNKKIAELLLLCKDECSVLKLNSENLNL